MEELKLVLAALANLGAAGKEAFIWWLVIDKVVVGAMILGGVLGSSYMILRFFGRINERDNALVEIGKEVGVEYQFWRTDPNCGHTAIDVLKAVKRMMSSSQ